MLRGLVWTSKNNPLRICSLLIYSPLSVLFPMDRPVNVYFFASLLSCLVSHEAQQPGYLLGDGGAWAELGRVPCDVSARYALSRTRQRGAMVVGAVVVGERPPCWQWQQGLFKSFFQRQLNFVCRPRHRESENRTWPANWWTEGVNPFFFLRSSLAPRKVAPFCPNMLRWSEQFVKT